jgi:hypothetical protein
MPQIVLTIIELIRAAISAAPQVIEVVQGARATIDALFTGKIITVEQQDKLHQHVNDLLDAALTGETPPEFNVEPDPE